MSTDGKETACSSDKEVNFEESEDVGSDRCDDEICQKKRQKPVRKVCFPEDDQLVTQYFEPANPWQDVPPINRAQLTAEYLECCRQHNTPPIETVLRQIRELPENCLGGGVRAPRLTLDGCSVGGAAPADALEALFRRVQFRRLHIDHAHIDDEGAEALFDMVEYYESATILCISGPRAFGIRGWQAASRMIKKSSQIAELEISNHPLESGHAPVLARALHTHSCRLRALCLQRASLAGDPLLCLVIALKSNNSIRELRLGDNRLGVSDAAQIASLLRYNSRLQLLDLSNNQIQDAGCGHIADALAEQSARSPPQPVVDPMNIESRGLAFLVLWNNQLTRNSAGHLSKALVSQSLCVLNIGRNALGTDTIRALAAVAGGALMSLGLQGARLGPDAGRALGDLVAGSKLQRLDLRENKIGSGGLTAILAALQHNTTLTQIDLDDPPSQESTTTLTAEESESALVARLTADIRRRCREQEAPASPRAVPLGRKISLTCHSHPPRIPSAASMGSPTGSSSPASPEERSRANRLRSPLPSPAGSPVPPHSRFSVSRVTPERDGSTTSLPPLSPSPSSRFKVVQVAEPPQIQVSPAGGRASRFSVTPNYDTMYQRTPSPSPPSYATPIRQTPVHTPPTPQTLIHTPTTTQTLIHTPPTTQTSITPAASIPLTPQTNITQPALCENNHCHPKDNKSDVNVENIHNTSAIDTKNCNSNVNSETNTQSDLYKDKSEELTHCESVDVDKGDKVLKTETKLVKNTVERSETEKVDVEVQVTVMTETKPAKVHTDQNESKNVDNKHEHKIGPDPMKQIEAITEDLGILIQEMREMSTKTKKAIDCSELDIKIDVPANIVRDNVVLKKNKSESSLDSPDLEVSRLMTKKLEGSPFCDSSSSLEISGSSMESLAEPTVQPKPMIIQESVDFDTELDRRKPGHVALSTESSLESNTSEITPVNSNFLNTSVSSNESVSPIFGKTKKIHDSLSSLEASVSSLDSKEKVMVTSADSGIEYSLQHPSEVKDDTSSNEGTLTHISSMKETARKAESSQGFQVQETLTTPKRTASLLDVPALKSKGLERMRKISWVAPSSSCHITKPEPQPEKIEPKLPSHLDKLLSLFQHPTSLFSRATEDDKKASTVTASKKDTSMTGSFWSWSSTAEKEKEEKDDSSEATDSTLSERNQVSYVEESFSKKLDSKTPSTDTENTLSEFQSIPTQGNSETSDFSQTDKVDRVTELTTDSIVQKSLVLSVNFTDDASSNGNKDPGACDSTDLIKPNDLNKNYPDVTVAKQKEFKEEVKEVSRPRSFAAVLSASSSENSLDKQTSPEGPSVDKLPSKVIRGIKENISPENTLTSSMTNTKTLVTELAERHVKNQPVVSAMWDIATNLIESEEGKAPIATIEETCDESADISVSSVPLEFIDDLKFIDEKNVSVDSGVTSLEGVEDRKDVKSKELEAVDLGKDALSYLIYENQDFEPESEQNIPNVSQEGSLAQELKEAENKEKLVDLSPELVIDEAVEVPEVFVVKDLKGLRTSPVIPERAKLKKANSLEDLSHSDDSPKTKTIVFKIPETTPRDIPQKRGKLRSRSGSSPKSLPECLNRPMADTYTIKKKKKKVSSLGKIAKDSLLALNMTEEEIAEFRRSYKLTSVESLKSLESVSEDANSQSGTSGDSRCRACLRLSQESLMSLDSITEDCKCTDDCDKADKLARSIR